MNKKKKTINALIKRKNLIKMLKLIGINRIEKGVLEVVEESIEDYIRNLCLRLKENMDVLGKRVLEKDDVRSVLEDSLKEEEIDY